MKRLDVYKCKTNNILLEVAVGGECECCKDGIEGFDLLEPKKADASTEKHVPFIEEHEDGYVVKVGKEVAHPMTEEHYIQFIEIIIDGDRVHRKYLKPGDQPLACFKVIKGENVVAREYCNLHGIWTDK